MPEETSPPTVYLVTARNSVGEASAEIRVEVQEAPSPPLYALPRSPLLRQPPFLLGYLKGEEIHIHPPSLSGSRPLLFTIQPALPLGLNLNSEDGSIRGRISSLAPVWQEEYVVQAKNVSGSSSCRLRLFPHARVFGRVFELDVLEEEGGFLPQGSSQQEAQLVRRRNVAFKEQESRRVLAHDGDEEGGFFSRASSSESVAQPGAQLDSPPHPPLDAPGSPKETVAALPHPSSSKHKHHRFSSSMPNLLRTVRESSSLRTDQGGWFLARVSPGVYSFASREEPISSAIEEMAANRKEEKMKGGKMMMFIGLADLAFHPSTSFSMSFSSSSSSSPSHSCFSPSPSLSSSPPPPASPPPRASRILNRLLLVPADAQVLFLLLLSSSLILRATSPSPSLSDLLNSK
eukprot:747019-Hanusia_phi.AAC.1